MNDLLNFLDKLKIWQLSLVLSVVLLSLGFTGSLSILFVPDAEIDHEKENLAIVAGMAFFATSILLIYFPPRNRDRRRDNSDRPRIAISATQTALAARFDKWVDFEDAAKQSTPDHDLPMPMLQKKCTELRLELATLQGLLMRRVDETGHHEVRYRYHADATTFIPSEES